MNEKRLWIPHYFSYEYWFQGCGFGPLSAGSGSCQPWRILVQFSYQSDFFTPIFLCWFFTWKIKKITYLKIWKSCRVGCGSDKKGPDPNPQPWIIPIITYGTNWYWNHCCQVKVGRYGIYLFIIHRHVSTFPWLDRNGTVPTYYVFRAHEN